MVRERKLPLNKYPLVDLARHPNPVNHLHLPINQHHINQNFQAAGDHLYFHQGKRFRDHAIHKKSLEFHFAALKK